MKLIGVYCENCGHTVRDNGTHCGPCGWPYPAEVLAMGVDHREATQVLLKNKVDADTAVKELGKATLAATPSIQGRSILGHIRYFIAEIFTKPTETKP